MIHELLEIVLAENSVPFPDLEDIPGWFRPSWLITKSSIPETNSYNASMDRLLNNIVALIYIEMDDVVATPSPTSQIASSDIVTTTPAQTTPSTTQQAPSTAPSTTATQTAPAQTTPSTTQQVPSTAPSTTATQTSKYTEADLEKARANGVEGSRLQAEALSKGVLGYMNFPNNQSKYSKKYGYGKEPIYSGYKVFGEMKNGKPDGYCQLFIADNSVVGYNTTDFIMGDFSNGLLNGKGSIYNANTSISGYFVNGKLEGLAQVIVNGERYDGNIKNGKFNGLGTFSDTKEFAQGNVWSGEWVDGQLKAGAMIDYKNSISYSGYFKNGLLQGFGLMHESGVRVWGDFKDGEPIEILGIYEVTQAEKDAARNASEQKLHEALSSVWPNPSSAVSGSTSSAQINTSIEAYKTKLKASQPPPKFNHVTSYGQGNWGSDYVYGY